MHRSVAPSSAVPPPPRPAFELFALEACLASEQNVPPPGVHDWVYVAAQALLSQPIDDAIRSALEHAAKSLGAERGWMYEYDDSGLTFRNTHEWSCEHVSAHVADLQHIPVSMIAWPHCHLVDNMAIMINDVAGLPPVGRELRAELLRQQIKSTLTLPVFFEGRLRAGIGFDATSRHRHWGPEIATQLARCAQLIATARYGQPAAQGASQAAAVEPGPAEPRIYLRTHGGVRGVTVPEIAALRSARDYTTVHLHDGTEVIDVRPLSVWEGILPTDRFMRIHRSAIVNLMHVRHLDRRAGGSQQRWEIALSGISGAWTVSRPYRRDLRYRLGV